MCVWCVCSFLVRALLCEVVQIKMGFYEQAKQQQPNAEEYLRNFLESEVKSLWPKGWMLTRYDMLWLLYIQVCCVMASL